MKKIFSTVMIIAFGFLCLAAAVQAGSQEKSMGLAAYKASEMIGRTVRNAQGDHLGRIADLAVDPQHGRISFAVLTRAGTLGVGETMIAVPLTAMSFSAENIILNVNRDRLASAPAFKKDNWAEMTRQQQIEDAYRFFGISPYWEEQGTRQIQQKQGEKSMEY